MSEKTKALSEQGVSIWLDDLSRARLMSGSLQQLIDDSNVVGVTTNPTIFAAALADGKDYAARVKELAAQGMSLDDAIIELTTADVRDACNMFLPIFEASDGYDGRVSIEVDPRLAHDTMGTIEQAKALWAKVDHPNVLIKIPATLEGLPAIQAVIAAGISVNVTLIFSVDRYAKVLDAYMTGLERRAAAGLDLSSVHSVASFFVSRVDSLIDPMLDKSNSEFAANLRGKAALANARLAYRYFTQTLESERWRSLAAHEARLQRPLWASTGVKDPAYPDSMYVTELVAPHCVNTMPEKTLLAVADHGEIAGDTITPNLRQAEKTFLRLTGIGIDLPAVFADLEADGVAKFAKSWLELMATVKTALAEA